MTTFRITEKRFHGGWLEVPFEALGVGDVFRVFEADGSQSEWDRGKLYRVKAVAVADEPPLGNFKLWIDRSVSIIAGDLDAALLEIDRQ